MEKLYTVNELTEILRVSQRTIYRYLKSGELKGVKVGSEWRFKESDLKKYLKIED